MSVFEDNWLESLSMDQNPRMTIDGKCLNLNEQNNKYSCANYSTRPNACKAFPFTLRKQDDGKYRLVIHVNCKGYGKGRIIDIKQKIIHCQRYANREFHKGLRFDFTSFEIDKGVVLIR
jgi:Fe-S-cluster containining protein